MPEVVAKEGRRVVAFEVLGTPAPKGSSRAFYKAGMKRAVLVKDNSDRQRSWDAAVRDAVVENLGRIIAAGDDGGPCFVQKALRVTIVFHMKRPAGHFTAKGLKRTAPTWPSTKPDIDKLARATLDAMTGSVFDDDSRIATLHLDKRWAEPGREGASIAVEEMT